MLPCSGRGNRGAENEGAEPRFEPWCPAVGEVMALTSRLGCLLSEKLLWREENPGGESGLSFKQSPPTAQAGARAPPGVLEAPGGREPQPGGLSAVTPLPGRQNRGSDLGPNFGSVAYFLRDSGQAT